jgi:hypothetical protein
MTPQDDATIRAAIAEKRIVEFSFRGTVRIAEPHDYGVRNGAPQLLVYQIGGDSRSGSLPNWRWILLADAFDFRMLEARFAGGRAAGRHAEWDQLFLRVGDPEEEKSR